MKCNKITISLAVNIFKEGRRFIADCPAVALSTHGGSFREVQKNFEEALNIWLHSTAERGALKKALLELGWTLKPVPSPETADYTKIPIHLLKQRYYPLSIPAGALQ
jgi:hypothetical protein